MWRKVALVAGIVVVGAASTLAGYAIFQHKNPVAAITQIFVPTPQQTFGKSNLLVLVEGLDYDYTENDIEYSLYDTVFAAEQLVGELDAEHGTKVAHLDVLDRKAFVAGQCHHMAESLLQPV